MLKLTYLENSFKMEHLAQPLEDWVKMRALLALRVGGSFSLEPSTASFLLPADLLYLGQLEAEARRDPNEAIALCVCDAEYVEVCLQGTWLTGDPQGEEGIFVAAMSDRAEFFVFSLWQESQTYASVRE